MISFFFRIRSYTRAAGAIRRKITELLDDWYLKWEMSELHRYEFYDAQKVQATLKTWKWVSLQGK